jgi:hypothetical protein
VELVKSRGRLCGDGCGVAATELAAGAGDITLEQAVDGTTLDDGGGLVVGTSGTTAVVLFAEGE